MTLANIITLLRFLFVPVIIYSLLNDQMDFAFFLFVVAGISDGADGFIARHFNQRSELGAYLDPLADKLLLVSVFVVLGYLDALPLWLVILIVSRDAMIVGAVMLSAVMGHPVRMKPLFVSKANTAMQIILVASVFSHLAFDWLPGLFISVLIGLTAVLTIGSSAAYLVIWMRHMSDYESDNRE